MRKFKSLAIKEEDHERGMIVGPVWAVLEDGTREPYETSRDDAGHEFAKWFRYDEAEKIAEKLGVDLEEW